MRFSFNNASFEQFWRHYLPEHSRPGTRAMHFIGTIVGILGVVAGVLTLDFALVLASIAIAYALAWLSHFLIEKNHPCAFAHPLMSWRSDMRMLLHWLSGKLPDELHDAGV
jgi:hypothetical protein